MGKFNSHGERIKAAIIATGLDLWRVDPASVSARRIGQTLGMTHGAILYHFGSTGALKMAIANEAVRTGDSIVTPLLIVSNHPAAASLTAEQRQAYLTGIN